MISKLLSFDGSSPEQVEKARGALQDLSAVVAADSVGGGVRVFYGERLPAQVLYNTAAQAGCPITGMQEDHAPLN